MTVDADSPRAARPLTHDAVRVLALSGRTDELVAACHDLLAADPDDLMAHVYLASYEAERGKRREARRLAERVVLLAPQSPMGFQSCVLVEKLLKSSERHRKARIRELLEAFPLDPMGLEAHVRLTHQELLQAKVVRRWDKVTGGKVDREVRDQISRALVEQPHAPALWRSLAVIEVACGNRAGSREAIGRALHIDANEPETLALYSLLLSQEGATLESLDAALALARVHPQLVPVAEAQVRAAYEACTSRRVNEALIAAIPPFCLLVYGVMADSVSSPLTYLGGIVGGLVGLVAVGIWAVSAHASAVDRFPTEAVAAIREGHRAEGLGLAIGRALNAEADGASSGSGASSPRGRGRERGGRR